MEERQKKLDEQRRKEEQRRSAVEGKRKLKQEEEKVQAPGVILNTRAALHIQLVLLGYILVNWCVQCWAWNLLIHQLLWQVDEKNNLFLLQLLLHLFWR
jgi:hypothetical protein